MIGNDGEEHFNKVGVGKHCSMPTDYSSQWLLAVACIVFVTKAMPEKKVLMMLTLFIHEMNYYCTTNFRSLA